MAKSRSKAARDNRANQLNPTHAAYHRSRGISSSEAAQSAASTKPVLNNRSRQLNPNDPTYLACGESSMTKPSTPEDQ